MCQNGRAICTQVGHFHSTLCDCFQFCKLLATKQCLFIYKYMYNSYVCMPMFGLKKQMFLQKSLCKSLPVDILVLCEKPSPLGYILSILSTLSIYLLHITHSHISILFLLIHLCKSQSLSWGTCFHFLRFVWTFFLYCIN